MIACNDYILLECVLFRILKLHFAGQAAYAPLMDLFHEVRGGVGGCWVGDGVFGGCFSCWKAASPLQCEA